MQAEEMGMLDPLDAQEVDDLQTKEEDPLDALGLLEGILPNTGPLADSDDFMQDILPDQIMEAVRSPSPPPPPRGLPPGASPHPFVPVPPSIHPSSLRLTRVSGHNELKTYLAMIPSPPFLGRATQSCAQTPSVSHIASSRAAPSSLGLYMLHDACRTNC